MVLDTETALPRCPEHPFTEPASEAAWDLLAPWPLLGLGEVFDASFARDCR